VAGASVVTLVAAEREAEARVAEAGLATGLEAAEGREGPAEVEERVAAGTGADEAVAETRVAGVEEEAGWEMAPVV